VNQVVVPLQSTGCLDLEALFNLPLERQRELLTALNRKLGPWVYETLVAEEAAYRRQTEALPIQQRDRRGAPAHGGDVRRL
jgi:hypothetical protein